MKRTPLYDQHVRDASMVINLKGFARAMQYDGHVAEHRATRERVSLCDVSHMGELEFKGPDALALVQKIITNDAGKLAVNQALYSAMCDERGILLDDLVCFRLAADHFVWVVNVTKTDDDHQWVLKHAQGMNVEVRNISTDTALLALQGPASREVLQRITKADLAPLKYYWLTQTVIHTEHAEVPCMISRTGYTGELGYEIMVARDLAPWVWDALLMVGRPLGIVSQGVAARESLRTEAGYLLNGNDMDARDESHRSGARLGRQAREGLHRQRRAGADRGEGSEPKDGGPRDRGAAHDPERLSHLPEREGGRTGDERPALGEPDRPQLRSGLRRDRGCRDRHRSRSRHPRDKGTGTRGRDAVLRAPGQGGTEDPHVVALSSCASANPTCGRVSKRERRTCWPSASRISVSAASATS